MIIKHPFKMEYQFKNRVEEFRPVFRLLMPLTLMVLLTSRIAELHVPFGSIWISATSMRYLITLSHVASAVAGYCTVCNRGWLYEFSAAFLVTVICLLPYIYWQQSIAFLTLFLVYLLGLLLLMTVVHGQLEHALQWGHLPESITNELKWSLRRNKKTVSLRVILLRRYLMVAFVVLFSVPALMVLVNDDTAGTEYYGNAHAVTGSAEENQLINNLDTLRLLMDSEWNELSAQKKADTLQVIADIETAHMGISPITVVVCQLDDQRLGTYDPADRMVRIDLDRHSDDGVLEILNTILHECRHAYQHDCILSVDWTNPAVQQGVYFAQVRQWRYEHQNYISASKNWEVYYGQSIEEDAREYADDGVWVYRQYLNLLCLPSR